MRHYLFLASTTLSLAGCAIAPLSNLDDGDDVEVASSALNGTVSFPDSSCSASQQTKIQSAMAIAYSNLNDSRMTSCMRNAIMSFYNAFPERVLTDERENMPTAIYCADLAPGVNAQAPAPYSTEKLTLDYGFLANSEDRIASVILHEVAHNKGYLHPTNEGQQEYSYTVNEQIEACSLSISSGASPAQPNGPRLDSLTPETRLAPIGETGGSAYSIACYGGKVSKGIYGHSGSLVDSFGVLCGPVGGATNGSTAQVGGSGGNAFTQSCASDEVLIGIQGRADQYVTSVGAICEKEADVRASLLTPRVVTASGGTEGLLYTRRCPAGMFVRKVVGKSGTFVDRMEVACQRLDSIEESPVSYPARVGATTGPVTWEECAGRAALVGLTYEAEPSSVVRLGGSCAIVSGSGVGSAVHQMPAHGPLLNGSITGEQSCAAGSVLVGLRFRAGTAIDAVGGICAGASAWRDGIGTTTNLALIGATSGTVLTRTCPVGQYLIGWLIGEDTTDVTSVQPICRSFQ
jgi:hypothetical protein